MIEKIDIEADISLIAKYILNNDDAHNLDHDFTSEKYQIFKLFQLLNSTINLKKREVIFKILESKKIKYHCGCLKSLTPINYIRLYNRGIFGDSPIFTLDEIHLAYGIHTHASDLAELFYYYHYKDYTQCIFCLGRLCNTDINIFTTKYHSSVLSLDKTISRFLSDIFEDNSCGFDKNSVIHLMEDGSLNIKVMELYNTDGSELNINNEVCFESKLYFCPDILLYNEKQPFLTLSEARSFYSMTNSTETDETNNYKGPNDVLIKLLTGVIDDLNNIDLELNAKMFLNYNIQNFSNLINYDNILPFLYDCLVRFGENSIVKKMSVCLDNLFNDIGSGCKQVIDILSTVIGQYNMELFEYFYDALDKAELDNISKESVRSELLKVAVEADHLKIYKRISDNMSITSLMDMLDIAIKYGSFECFEYILRGITYDKSLDNHFYELIIYSIKLSRSKFLEMFFKLEKSFFESYMESDRDSLAVVVLFYNNIEATKIVYEKFIETLKQKEEIINYFKNKALTSNGTNPLHAVLLKGIYDEIIYMLDFLKKYELVDYLLDKNDKSHHLPVDYLEFNMSLNNEQKHYVISLINPVKSPQSPPSNSDANEHTASPEPDEEKVHIEND